MEPQDAQAEEIYAEDDGDLTNKMPESALEATNFVITLFSEYGWFILIGVLVALWMKQRMEPRINRWKEKREYHAELSSQNAESAEKRITAMMAARQKQQDEYNAKAASWADMQKEKEEERRQKKIEEWENHQAGKGYHSKTKAPEDAAEPVAVSGGGSNTPRQRLRTDEYNPLTGEGGGGSNVSPRRRGGSGAGGG